MTVCDVFEDGELTVIKKMTTRLLEVIFTYRLHRSCV